MPTPMSTIEDTILVKDDTICVSTNIKCTISHNYNTFGVEVSLLKSTSKPDTNIESLQEEVRLACAHELDRTIEVLKSKAKTIREGVVNSIK